jgi:Thioredoxin
MAYKFFEEKILQSGLSYESYMQNWKKEIADFNPENASEKEKKDNEYKKLNLQRSKRLGKYYNVSNELKEMLKSIEDIQIWMVITENWCGDSAQNLPLIAKIAYENPNINLKIIGRDSHLDIIDNFPTNGTRSIPKLVAFNKKEDELFQWGPRPKKLQDLFYKFKNEGVEKNKIYKQLHVWYPKYGVEEVEKEFIVLIHNSSYHQDQAVDRKSH